MPERCIACRACPARFCILSGCSNGHGCENINLFCWLPLVPVHDAASGACHQHQRACRQQLEAIVSEAGTTEQQKAEAQQMLEQQHGEIVRYAAAVQVRMALNGSC